MKLLKEGEAFKPFEHVCNHCTSLLLVEKGDIKCNYYAGDAREKAEVSYLAACCFCTTPFLVNPTDIPLGLRNRLLKEKRGY